MNSLEKASLNLIVQEFEMFHFAWTLASDETLILNFKFLQKKYSAEIWSQLYKKSKFRGKYLEFLANGYLKYFDKKWLTMSSYENSVETVICRLPNLTFVSLDHVCNDEILKILAESCPHIAELDASCSSVTDIGIMYLCKNKDGKIPCPGLKKLSLELCDGVSCESVKYLIQTISSIEIINYNLIAQILYDLHKGDLPDLEKAHRYNLTHLTFYPEFTYNGTYTEILKVCLTVCPKLISVVCYINDKNQLNVFNSTTLREVYLSLPENIPNIDINTFLENNGRNLIALKAERCIISVNNLARSCPKLISLHLQDTVLLNDADDPKAIFQSLNHCTFQLTTFNDDINRALGLLLSSSPNLEGLYFFSCKLTPGTHVSILKCYNNKCLKNIYFVTTQIPLRFVKDIVESFKFLETLKLINAFETINEKIALIKLARTAPCISFL